MTCGLGLLVLLLGCGSGGGGKSSRSSAAPVTSTTPTTPVTPSAGPTPLPANATLTRVGAPPGGLPVISDLEVFDGKLWLAESLNPLGQFGAQLWSWDPAAGFSLVVNDPTSQGFLRARGAAVAASITWTIPGARPSGSESGT
jgi:hypothetical protein